MGRGFFMGREMFDVGYRFLKIFDHSERILEGWFWN